MANLISKTVSVTGNSDAIALDWMAAPFQATVAIWLTANANYALQYTLDNILTTDAASVRWFTDTRAPGGSTTSLVVPYNENSIGPIAAVRLVVASLTGPIEVKVAQGMA